MKILTSTTKQKIFILMAIPILSIMSILTIATKTTNASYIESNLIDDYIFLKANTMSQSDIQNFLSEKKSYLSTYSSFSDRDNTNVSAAQIIYEAAQDFGINPQVILATLQKEQSLVTTQNPIPSQINYAMGYGCPDSGSCSHPGLFNQIANGTWQLRFNYERANGNNIWWNPATSYACAGPSQYYNKGLYSGSNINFSDDSGNVYDTLTIANASTASLYCYTPHVYSITSIPPYSGSYNFVTSFENWFGSTTNSHLSFSVIQDPNSAAQYLQTSTPNGNYKYYLPSIESKQEWKLDNLPITQVSQSYFNSLVTGPWVGHVLKDDWNNLFIVENGTLHYISNNYYAKLWGSDASTAIQSLGITYTLPSGSWAGRFIRDSSTPNGQIWLIDNGNKRAIPDGNTLYEWGYVPNQITTISASYINNLPTLSPVSQYVSDSTTHYLIDMNRKLTFANMNIENDFVSTKSPDIYDSNTLSYFQTSKTWQFVVDSSNGRWYMLENGQKHYITSPNIAAIWGNSSDRPLVSVSDGLIASLPDGDSLTYVIQTQNPSMYWVIDSNTKRYIPDGYTATAWNGTVIPPIYSNQSVADLAQGPNITSIINGTGSPFTYIMDNGSKRYLSDSFAMKGWDVDSAISNTSNQLVATIPEGSFISYVIKDTSNNGYLMMDDIAYPIDPAFTDAWGINSSTPSVANATIARYPVGQTLGGFIKINNTPYMIVNGQKIPIKKYADAYPSNIINGINLPSDYFKTTTEASFLIKSTDLSDTRMWLMANGKKVLLDSFIQQVSYGYISRDIKPTALTSAILNTIPDSPQSFSQLIQNGASGIKFVNFGYALGFPNGDTLSNYIGTNQIIQVSASVYNNFLLQRSISRLIVDDYGNYYFIENNIKRHIMSGKALDSYRSYSVSYLEGITMAIIPDGEPIN